MPFDTGRPCHSYEISTIIWQRTGFGTGLCHLAKKQDFWHDHLIHMSIPNSCTNFLRCFFTLFCDGLFLLCFHYPSFARKTLLPKTLINNLIYLFFGVLDPILCKVLMITNTNVMVHMFLLECVVEIGSFALLGPYIAWLTSVWEQCLRTVLRSAYVFRTRLRTALRSINSVANWQGSKEYQRLRSTSE